jgi:hypothetical protein
VLASGGRLFATWYLLSGDNAASPPSPLRFYEHTRPAAVENPDEPESLVAHGEDWVCEHLAAHGLQPPAVQAGSWSGRPGLTRQDIVVAYRA